jgi:Holliday junction resolvase RusA-like endonuclease
MKINDQGIRTAFAAISKDNRITRPDVEKLIKAAYDSARVTSTEKADLQRILAEKSDQFTAPAKAALENFLNTLRPDGTHPAMQAGFDLGNTDKPLKLKDPTIKSTWEAISANGRVTRPDLEKLIKVAYDSGRVTNTEKGDLQAILSRKGDLLTPAARTALESFLGGLRADGTHPDMKGVS